MSTVSAVSTVSDTGARRPRVGDAGPLQRDLDHLVDQAAASGIPAVRRGVANHPATPARVLSLLADDTDLDVRLGVAAHAATPPEVLARLAGDPEPAVRRVALEHPGCPESARFADALGDDEHVVLGEVFAIDSATRNPVFYDIRVGRKWQTALPALGVQVCDPRASGPA